jgi:hypothetical protein
MTEETPQERFYRLHERLYAAHDLPEARALPSQQRNAFARLIATELHVLGLIVTSPLPLGFEDEIELPDGAKVEYLGNELIRPAGEGLRLELRSYHYRWSRRIEVVTADAVRAAYHACGVFSATAAFAIALPVKWKDPADPEMVSIHSRRPDWGRIAGLLTSLESLDLPTRAAIELALGWYWNGQLVSDTDESVIFEFVCNWNAIEALSEGLGGNPKDSREERQRLRAALRDVLPAEDIEEAVKAIQYRKRTRFKVQAMLEKLVGEKAAGMMQRIFEEKDDGKSLFDLRNDLAHGALFAFESGLESRVRQQIWRLRNYVESILRAALASGATGC